MKMSELPKFQNGHKRNDEELLTIQETDSYFNDWLLDNGSSDIEDTDDCPVRSYKNE